ncbi:MAG: hypothetical protein ACK47B_18430 [Armatimonadota bacterium]
MDDRYNDDYLCGAVAGVITTVVTSILRWPFWKGLVAATAMFVAGMLIHRGSIAVLNWIEERRAVVTREQPEPSPSQEEEKEGE